MIDLRHNYPALDTQSDILRELLQRVAARLEPGSLQLPPWAGSPRACEAFAQWLDAPGSQEVVLCSGGNHALLVTILALGLAGKTIVTDEFTYGALMLIAGLAGVRVLPCRGDAWGMCPGQLGALCRAEAVAAVFLQPTIHNPTCVTIPAGRRVEIAETLQRHGLTLIEDDAYRFLHESPPQYVSRLVPDHAVTICSFSKTFSPLLKLSCLSVPARLKPAFETAIRLTSSGTSSLLVDLARLLVADGTLTTLIEHKRVAATSRQMLSREILHGVQWDSHPSALHGWIHLPEGRSADNVRDVLKVQGVDVSSGSEFAAPGVDGRHRLRFSLGAENDAKRLSVGLEALRSTIVNGPA